MVKNEDYDIYTAYYLNQAGCGFSNIYAGPMYQKGYGIGSFLGGLFRSVYPILKKGASIVGSELLKSGSNLISDIASAQDPQTAIKRRGKEAINNLSRVVGEKMFGTGYKTTKPMKRKHSGSKSQPVKKRKAARASDTKKKVTKKVTKSKKKSSERSKSDIFDIFT